MKVVRESVFRIPKEKSLNINFILISKFEIIKPLHFLNSIYLNILFSDTLYSN